MSRPSSEDAYLASLVPASVRAQRFSRRNLLVGAGAFAVTPALLAACSSGSSTPSASTSGGGAATGTRKSGHQNNIDARSGTGVEVTGEPVMCHIVCSVRHCDTRPAMSSSPTAPSPDGDPPDSGACRPVPNAVSTAVAVAAPIPGTEVISSTEASAAHQARASLLAMGRALEGLGLEPDLVLVDGNVRLECRFPCEALVRGDARVPEIMAASILAKTRRDGLMRDLARAHPGYGFAKHKGYPTREHREAIRLLGVCPIHRRSFRLDWFS